MDCPCLDASECEFAGSINPCEMVGKCLKMQQPGDELPVVDLEEWIAFERKKDVQTEEQL